MGEPNDHIKSDPLQYLKWHIGILIGVILIFIIATAIDINLHNKQFDTNTKPYSHSKQTTNPLSNLKIDSPKVYSIKSEDLQKVNDHIEYLTEKVESEVKRTQ